MSHNCIYAVVFTSHFENSAHIAQVLETEKREETQYQLNADSDKYVCFMHILYDDFLPSFSALGISHFKHRNKKWVLWQTGMLQYLFGVINLSLQTVPGYHFHGGRAVPLTDNYIHSPKAFSTKIRVTPTNTLVFISADHL